MSVTNSINMTLPIPSVGNEPGPDYAFDVNNCLTLIDSHDHTPGRGVQITPAGLNINTDFTLNSNSLTDTLNVVFTEQTIATSVLQALSVAPGSEAVPLQDLWYTDSAGNKVQITDGGALAAVTTTVQGITYSIGTFSFRQTQDSLPTTPANLDAGTVTIRPNVAATAFGVTLQPSGGISSQYALTLPLPVAQTSFVTQDPSGVLAGSVPIAGGITQTNLAANSVDTSQLIDLNVTNAKIADGTIAVAKLAPTVISTNSTGMVPIPAITLGWYASAGNDITLGPGQWRLTGYVNWITTANVFNDTRFGFFGANGTNAVSLPPPAALVVASQQSGRLGEIKGSQIQGTNMVNYWATAPETIITLTAVSTTVYLVAFHGSLTGGGINYQIGISAEQIR